jgi:hypothetical protein
MSHADHRTHRIGQKDSVLVQHLVLEDSLDASMVRTLLKKQEVIEAAVDGTARSDARRDNLFEGPYAEALLAAAAVMRSDAASYDAAVGAEVAAAQPGSERAPRARPARRRSSRGGRVL